MKNPYQQAQSVEVQASIESASPHELIDLLLQGARTHIAKAQGHTQRHQIKEKGEQIGRALSIIEGLKTSLNHEQGGEIATNLLSLYDYVQQLLLKANLNHDEELLTQANTLLSEIHQAWKSIAANDRHLNPNSTVES